MFRKNTKTVKVVVSVILLGLLIFLGNTGFLNWSRSIFFGISNGVRSYFFSLAQGISVRSVSVFRRSELSEANETLKEENQRLTSKLADLFSLEEENKVLRQALKIKQEKKREVVMAGIKGFQRQFRDEFLILNVGSEDGVSIGDLALSEDRSFVGRIKEVWAKSSRLIISSSASESYNARLLSIDLPVLVRGNNNQELMLDLVPNNVDVKKGDLVLTSGKGDIFLDNLVIGEVVSIRKFDNQIFQEVLAKTKYDPDFLRKIVIVKK